MDWTESIIQSLAPIAKGLPNIGGQHYNAVLAYTTEEPSNLTPELIKDEFGNYVFSEETIIATEKEIKARLYPSKPSYISEEGMDKNQIFLKGRLVEPLTIPPEIYQINSQISAIVNEQKGTFVFAPFIETPNGWSGELSQSLGERIEGWFQFDTTQF